MQKLSDILQSSSPLNHAYLIIGDPKEIIVELNIFLEQRLGTGFTSISNPDFHLKEFSTWGVDESRELKAFQSRRPITWPVKVSVIVPEVFTFEAQNSLLKTLEEPSSDTHFFIIARRLGEYLPTVISRCQIIKIGASVFTSEISLLTKDWLSADIAKRFEINKIILKKHEDNPSYILNWLNCLLDVYWSNVSDWVDKNALSGAQSLFEAISYANQRGGSLRVILEHLAGVVPVVKMC